jgi:tight adherence protein C
MSTQHLVFILIVFAVVTGTVLVGVFLFTPSTARRRLAAITEADSPASVMAGPGWVERVGEVAAPFAKLSLPEEGWEKSPLRTRFVNAGWRTESAPAVYFAAKTVLAIGLPLLAGMVMLPFSTGISSNTLLLVLLVSAAIGYYLPNVVLARAIAERQREVFENFPDALDLLTVCVEAGLSLDQAMAKVADEMQLNSLILSQELQMVLIEMRAGFTKEKALRNLALRTGVEDIDTLVAMLIQSERFGTSMGESLRVHSENLRSKRRFRAEEAAAKIALKLLFPLIFFIFPTLLLVLLGPAFIQIYRVLLPTMSGGA